ncbi:uncharacterized protein [Lepisosteus oculatus]|uniref:uncharacterized protein isoform X4 n=1 Tax=Lepisosteus oculatus TaxID=7918 RepID=UPI003723A6E0
MFLVSSTYTQMVVMLLKEDKLYSKTEQTTQDTVVFLLTGNTTSSPNVTSELPSTSPTPAIVLLPPEKESTREDNRYETLQFGKNQDEVYYNMTCTSTNRSSSTIPPAQRPLPRPPGQSEGSYSMHLPGTYSNHAAIKNYR